jgi:hypothetical protein
MKLSLAELAARSGMSVPAAQKAIAELQELGFLAPKSSISILDGGDFRLTMFDCDGFPPTHDYLRPEAMQIVEKAKAERRSRALHRSARHDR